MSLKRLQMSAGKDVARRRDGAGMPGEVCQREVCGVRGFVVKRLLIAIPVLLGITFIIFVLLNVVPGDPVALMMGERMSPEVIERVRGQMHLDDPWPVRYVHFLVGAVQGDLGESYKLRRPVAGLLLDAFPTTLQLAFAAALAAWCIGIPAGIL